MKFSLKSTPKWLCIPPAVALLLVLGPLSMQGGAAGGTNKSATTAPAPTATEPEVAADTSDRPQRPAPVLPRTPDLWQMSSALVGVLLLGFGAVLVLRKLRGGPVPIRGKAPLITLRQSLRLSARQAVHAIEFDDRILLIGEHERGISLLESGRAPERANDEAEVLARQHAIADHDATDADQGAVPKDLVIPRPPQRTPQRQVAAATSSSGPRKNVDLNDFRTLLQKVGRS